MARKRTPRGYHYDKKTGRHEWTIEKEGKRYRVRDRDEARARAKFEELKRKLAIGIDLGGERQPLREYFPRYLAAIAHEVKQSTIHDYQKRADYYILPTLGDYPLVDLKLPKLRAWNAAMLEQTEWSLNSIGQAIGLLERVLDLAVEEGLLEANPAKSLKRPKRRKGDELKIDDDEEGAKIFTAEQIDRLLAEVERTNKYHGLHLLYVLAIRLGIRRGELLGLRWKDIDFAAGVIRIRQQVIRLDKDILVTKPKTESAIRDLPMEDDIAALLRSYKLTLGGRGRVYVFPNEEGSYRRPDGIDQHFRRVCARLEFAGYTFHSLRKYAITDWRSRGVDLEIAAALAGHKGVKITAETYSQATMERKRAAIGQKKQG